MEPGTYLKYCWGIFVIDGTDGFQLLASASLFHREDLQGKARVVAPGRDPFNDKVNLGAVRCVQEAREGGITVALFISRHLNTPKKTERGKRQLVKQPFQKWCKGLNCTMKKEKQ